MPTSVRLDPDTQLLLQRLARRSGRSKSEVLREALRRYAEEPEPSENNGLYALIADLVGTARGGAEALAREHKNAYLEALKRKHHR